MQGDGTAPQRLLKGAGRMPEDMPLHLRLHRSTVSLQSNEIDDIMAQSTQAPSSRNQSIVSHTLQMVAMSANGTLRLMVMRAIVRVRRKHCGTWVHIRLDWPGLAEGRLFTRTGGNLRGRGRSGCVQRHARYGSRPGLGGWRSDEIRVLHKTNYIRPTAVATCCKCHKLVAITQGDLIWLLISSCHMLPYHLLA